LNRFVNQCLIVFVQVDVVQICIITNGNQPAVIYDILEGKQVGTLFKGHQKEDATC